MKSHIAHVIRYSGDKKYEQIGTAAASENIECIFKSDTGTFILSLLADVTSEFKISSGLMDEDILPCRAWVNFNGSTICK